MIIRNGRISSLLLIAIALVISFSGCKKDEEPVFPEVITKPVIPSLTDYADCGGIISDNGTVDIISRGVIWGTDPNLIIGNEIGYTLDGKGAGEFNSLLRFLEYNTFYYVRAYAETTTRIIYGNILEFGLWRTPTVKTAGASLVKGTSAILTGLISPSNSPTVASIQFGTDINYSRKISLIEEPISGYSVFLLTYEIKDLDPNSVYHYRIVAENMSGVTYGRDTLFKTKEVVEDIDHNLYPVVLIGEQAWMMENLKTTHYSNGDPIPSTPGSSASLTTGNYWNYNDNEQFVPVYGRLYNYYAVADGRNVCPVGWHVPTLQEMDVLKSYVGTASGGNKLKERGNIHWDLPDIGATNESEFTALPGGYRNSAGVSSDVKKKGYWLTSTGSGTARVNILSLSYSDPGISITTSDRTNAISVRCVKGILPLAITAGADNIEGTSAVVHGIINRHNEPVSVSFDYGLTTFYGNQLTLSDQLNEDTDINVDGQLSGLLMGKTYHYRIRVESRFGSTYGSDAIFTTSDVPTALTYNNLFLSSGSVLLRGKVTANGKPATVVFLLGETTSYGQLLTPPDNMIEGTTAVYFEYELNGLPPGKTFHYAIKGLNDLGETVGNDCMFTTDLPQDFEGNLYGTVWLRSRYWMMQNLETTHFRNGDPIPEIQDLTTFMNATTPAYCNYNNSSDLGNEYGKLYNSYVATDPRNVCPSGWNVPTQSLWSDLIINTSESQLKETGTIHWSATTPEVTNLSGFTAYAGGYRYTTDYKGLGIGSYWWSSSPGSSTTGANFYYVRLDITAGNQTILYDTRNHAYSLRCVKAGLPLAQTGSAIDITATSATLTGIANGNGSSATVSFGWGLSFTNEHIVQAVPNVISGNSAENIIFTFTGLYPNQTYYYKIIAVSPSGTVYGLDRSFKTLPSK